MDALICVPPKASIFNQINQIEYCFSIKKMMRLFTMSMRTTIDLPVERCPDGYLRNPEDWNEDLARQLASEWHGLEFTDEHFSVLNFVRKFHEEHQVTPDVRDATKYLVKNGMDKKDAKKYLFKLFPNGYMQQGVQLAGMRRPTAWCVG